MFPCVYESREWLEHDRSLAFCFSVALCHRLPQPLVHSQVKGLTVSHGFGNKVNVILSSVSRGLDFFSTNFENQLEQSKAGLFGNFFVIYDTELIHKVFLKCLTEKKSIPKTT